MKRIVAGLGMTLVLGMFGVAHATNGYQLIGVGQTQKSMGGAVTAAPMDTMTAISNPAGMARVGNRADFSMEAFMPKRSVDFSGTGGGRTEGGSELYGIPSVGWVAKAFGRDNIYFGGGMFATSGLGVDYDQITMAPAGAFDPVGGTVPTADITFDGYSAIQFWKMAPTVAWNATDDTSVGFSLNLDYQSLTIRQQFNNIPFWNPPVPPAGTVPTTANTTERNVTLDLGRPTSQLGAGASIGFLHNLSDMFTVGASYTTRQYFGVAQYRLGQDDLLNFNGADGTPGTYKLDLDFPQQAALGVSVTPHPRWLVALDVKWIDWSSTHDQVTLGGPSAVFDANGDGIKETTTFLDFGWKDQIIWAIGTQWLATDRLALRMGYNYAKAPIDEDNVFNNIILPALVEHHLTFGFGYELGEHWGIGGTYMKAFNNKITGVGDVPAGFAGGTPFGPDSGAQISLEETSIGVSLSYRM